MDSNYRGGQYDEIDPFKNSPAELLTGGVVAKKHYKNNVRSTAGHIYTEKLIQLAKKNNVNVYVVIPPFSQDYKSSIPEYNELFSGIIQLCNKNNVKLISFYNSSEYTNEYFYDTDHLNLNGAKKFTKELKDIIDLK